MSTLRRPTVRDGSNATITPYTGAGNTRSCGKCLKHRPQAGGAINKRTRMWECAACGQERAALAKQKEAA